MAGAEEWGEPRVNPVETIYHLWDVSARDGNKLQRAQQPSYPRFKFDRLLGGVMACSLGSDTYSLFLKAVNT